MGAAVNLHGERVLLVLGSRLVAARLFRGVPRRAGEVRRRQHPPLNLRAAGLEADLLGFADRALVEVVGVHAR